MKTPPDPESPWNDLVARARADRPAPSDPAVVLRALRAATLEPSPAGWAAEFSAVFARGHMLSSCVAGAAALAAVASWQAWEVWQDLPWLEWLSSWDGGGL